MGTSSKGKLRISFTQGLSKKDKDGAVDFTQGWSDNRRLNGLRPDRRRFEVLRLTRRWHLYVVC